MSLLVMQGSVNLRSSWSEFFLSYFCSRDDSTMGRDKGGSKRGRF